MWGIGVLSIEFDELLGVDVGEDGFGFELDDW